ncbi:class I SAM-dependent methyltransferase [Sporolactobacillus kofuensis]|uniref:Class I SAM-dependent methyltransferase n=1 Tax=Sporolactobacillus kofuensis TaxID=269672 RepID=A0ABW1WEX9_9BACL|nr:class I SAM-dependent methyltransferase [Sporolactobacillus kofuensis]MCO7176203.1 class I SAM-dependent methyltransferase [Sporolactobacillus kofuensis]
MNKECFDEETWQKTIFDVWHLLEREHISATLEGESAVQLQGCSVDRTPSIRFSIQWDALESFRAKLIENTISEVNTTQRTHSFTFTMNGFFIEIVGYLGTVVRTDPDRLIISVASEELAVKSLNYYLRTLEKSNPIRLAIKRYYYNLQVTDADQNGQAWNDDAYQAWINRFGTPDQAAQKIKQDPIGRLGSLSYYLKDVRGQKIMNLLGSHAGKALALALMGAEVTVVDISAENAAYAKHVANALDVPLNYVISDVLQLPVDQYKEKYDQVFMELGILHYFIDLEPIADLVFNLLKPGGQFVIQEFHPISTKLVTTKGKRQIVFGNYFDQSLHTRSVAFAKHLDSHHQSAEEGSRKVYLREWTLGEIVTTFAQSGLTVRRLDEQPNMKINDIGLPKLFTLVCAKPN